MFFPLWKIISGFSKPSFGGFGEKLLVEPGLLRLMTFSTPV